MDCFDVNEWLEHQSNSFFDGFLDGRGEGEVLTMQYLERDSLYVPYDTIPERHGPGQVGSFETKLRVRRLPVKRSFARAMKRLQQTGFCVYRGQVHTQPVSAPADPSILTPPRCTPRKASGPRLSCMTWNCGGLTTDTYHELLLWLSLHRIDVCFVQGTRWGMDEPWESNGFALVPSPAQDHAHDGLLTIIRTQLCPTSAISHANILEGRLQHTRCHLDSVTIDLVNCYQHPNNPARNRPDPLRARDSFWHAWEDLLAKLPFRNLLLTAGDYNCSLAASTSQTTSFPDQAAFKAIVDRFSLASVRVHDPGPTYIGPAGRSTIDYLFARRPQLDQLSRQARCIRTFPLNTHRGYPDHAPVVTTVPLNWKAWYCRTRTATSHLSRATMQTMRQEWNSGSSHWQSFESQLDQQLRQESMQHVAPQQLTNQVVQACSNHFRTSPVQPEVTWNLPATRSLVALKWRHLHLARNTQSCTRSYIVQVFQAWHHMSQHFKLRTRLRKHCQAKRQERVNKVIQEATGAAYRHDSKRLYMAIRSLTPKQPRRQIRFRQAGIAQTPQEELHALRAHFEAIFCASTSDLPTLQSMTMPFTQADLEHELRATKIDKAVASGTLPPLILKHFAPQLASWLYRYLEITWQHPCPSIPSEWKDAALTLLAKRPVTTPSDLRPIALTCGTGKAVLGALVKAASSHMAEHLIRFPLFAYTERRGVFEALCYVFDHCHQVRTDCTLANPSHWMKQAGHTKPKLTGGLMLSLDLSQAFDRLPRSKLFEGLLSCHCPPSIALLLVNWLKDAKYSINHRGLTSEIVATCGVRQGCRGSPLEWNVFMTVILQAICPILECTVSQLIHWLICFADDLLLRWKINSSSEVHHALHAVGQLLDVLEQHHLIFNPKKTVMLIRLEGSQVAKLTKQCLIRTKEGLFVRIPRSSNETLLPVVHSHTYLGCKISYHCFEKLTLNHRIHIGRTAFQRLRPWLVKRHSVTSTTRAQVWRSCILSSYLHGLAAAGLTQDGLRKLITRCNADLRSLRQSPGHITHECNVELFQRLGVTDPLLGLQAQWKQLFDRLEQNQAHLSSHDFLHSLPLLSTKQRVMSIFDHAKVQVYDWELACPYCTQLFADMTALNRHLVLTHKITRTAQAFLPIRDALQGRPQCRHCHFKFYDWGGLKRHITWAGCPMFDPDLDSQVPPADQVIFREHAEADAWMALIEQPDLIGVLREHCVLCGRHFFSGKALLEHLNLNHYEMWLTSKAQAPAIIHALRDGKPCQACGKPIARAHACHVIRQMAILQDLCTTNRSTEDVVQGKPVAPSPPKPEAHCQIPETGQRIKISPRTATSFKSINSYHPGRDSADGTPTCAHCLCIQGSYFALRRHIETGCCKSFNANRPLGSHIPLTWPELMTMAANNETDLILRKHAFVQALRSVCALCGRQCTKPGALLQHHLQDHATVVHEAADRSTNLQNQAAAMGRPCYCGNRVVRKGHQCVVFNQIAMLQVTACNNAKNIKPAADTKQESSAAVTLSQVPKHDEAELEVYWDHPDLRSSLKVRCQLCQLQLTFAELETHLMTSHATLAAPALEKYSDCMSPRLDCCRFCLDSNGIEEYCPAALHLAFIRAHKQVSSAPSLLDGGNLRDERGRHDGPSSGHSRGTLQQYFQAQPKARQARGPSIRESGHAGTDAEDHEPSHGSDLETRVSTPGSSLYRPVPVLLSDESARHPPGIDVSGLSVEEGHGNAQSQQATSGGPLPTGLSDHLGQNAGACKSIPEQFRMGTGDQAAIDHTRREVALLAMVQRGEMSQADNKDTTRHGQDAETLGGPCRGSAGGTSYPEVQVVEKHLQGDQAPAGLPVPATSLPSGQFPVGDSESALPQLDLAGDPGAGSPAQPEGEPFGHYLSQILEATRKPNVLWPIQQKEVKGTLMALRLINPGNLCFVHASILAFFWGFLHLRRGKWSDLGGAASLLMDLCGRSTPWVDIRDLESWSQWISNWDDGMQHDATEFMKAFLAYTRPPALTGSWTRKVQSDEQITIMDRGTAFLPPSLTTSDATAEKVSLQALIDEWHTYMGMVTAFDADSPLLCFQIDRFKPDSQGTPVKATWQLELSVVEILVSPDPMCLETEVYEYVPIAGIVHQGHDQQGHLQGVGRTTKGWVLFDDGKESSCLPHTSIPRPSDWICVWLIRQTRHIEVLPSYYTRGHDAKVHQVVQLLDQQSWQELESREELIRYFAVHCGACSQIFTDMVTLARHVFQRHFSLRWTLTRPAEIHGLDHRGLETPCLMCGAVPLLTPGMTSVPSHGCTTVLNLALAKAYHEEELKARGEIFGAPRPPAEPVLNDSLGSWLAMED